MLEVGALVIPLTSAKQGEDTELKAVRLPDKEDRRKVYLLRQDTEFKLPQAMIDRGVAVTAYEFPAPFDSSKSLTGAKPVDRWAILQEFRQLPGCITDQLLQANPETTDPNAAIEKQSELIELALFFYRVQLGTETPPAGSKENFPTGWRAIDGNPEHQRAGRALATLFLPTKQGFWEPARQLTWSDVDESAINWGGEADIDRLQFLTFLGVNPDVRGQCFALVEDGEQGLVAPMKTPPHLVLLKPGEHPPDMTIVLKGNSENPQPKWESPGIAGGVKEMWEYLKPLVVHELAASGSDEKDSRPRSTVHQMLSKNAWVGLDDGRYAAPECLVLLPPQDRRSKILDRVPFKTDEKPTEREMWVMLGAMPGLDAEVLAQDNGRYVHMTLDSLPHQKGLTNDDLAKGLEPERQQALLEAFSTLFNAACSKPKQGVTIPLLIYRGSDQQSSSDSTHIRRRRLAWDRDMRGGYVVTEARDREVVARHFPHLPIVVAVLGAGVKELQNAQHGLASQVLTVHVEIAPFEEMAEQNNCAEFYKKTIEPLLPGLLALAHLSSLAVPKPVSECRDRWSRLKFRHVRNAWGIYRLVAGGVEIDQKDDQRKTSYGDVLWKEDNRQGEIIFDGTDERNGTISLPPLSEFGEAIAAHVAGNRMFSDLFSRALGLIDLENPEDRRRFEAFLTKEMADSLTKEFAQVFIPLTEEQTKRFLEHVTSALAEIGLTFRDPPTDWQQVLQLNQDKISPPNNCPWPMRTASELQEKLNQFCWDSIERGFIPQVDVAYRNDRELDRWWEAQAISLENLLHYLQWQLSERMAEGTQEVGDTWHDLLAKARQRLDFDPEQVVRDYLGKIGLADLFSSMSKLNAGVRNFRPKFKPVKDIISTGICVVDCSTGLGRVELAPQDSAEYARRSTEQGILGHGAEEQLVHHIASKTKELMEKHGSDKCWKLLFQSIPLGGKTERVLEVVRAKYEQQRTEETLRKALWISNIWGNAGFDVLGLKEKDGGLIPVRYECKTLPGNSGTFRVFLSANELKVFRKVRSENRQTSPASIDTRYLGEWKLIGVAPDGLGIDLTGLLEPIVESDLGLLEPIAKKGLTPDAFILRFSLSSPAQSGQEVPSR